MRFETTSGFTTQSSSKNIIELSEAELPLTQVSSIQELF